MHPQSMFCWKTFVNQCEPYGSWNDPTIRHHSLDAVAIQEAVCIAYLSTLVPWRFWGNRSSNQPSISWNKSDGFNVSEGKTMSIYHPGREIRTFENLGCHNDIKATRRHAQAVQNTENKWPVRKWRYCSWETLAKSHWNLLGLDRYFFNSWYQYTSRVPQASGQVNSMQFVTETLQVPITTWCSYILPFQGLFGKAQNRKVGTSDLVRWFSPWKSTYF